MAIPHPEQAKYLYSPRNGIVCINTALKRRMCPWMIPCNHLDAGDIKDDPQVTMVYTGEYDSSKAAEEAAEMAPEPEVSSSAEESFKTLRLQVMSSEDKAELRQIGAGLGEELVKSMNIKTMKKLLLKKIDKIQEQS